VEEEAELRLPPCVQLQVGAAAAVQAQVRQACPRQAVAAAMAAVGVALPSLALRQQPAAVLACAGPLTVARGREARPRGSVC
jgi:hypothetical protein